MTVEEKLKALIIERYGSLYAFTKKLGVANSTINSVLIRGVAKANISTVLMMCEELQISADELAEGNIVTISKKMPK